MYSCGLLKRETLPLKYKTCSRGTLQLYLQDYLDLFTFLKHKKICSDQGFFVFDKDAVFQNSFIIIKIYIKYLIVFCIFYFPFQLRMTTQTVDTIAIKKDAIYLM